MKFLIIGASGFLGRHLQEHFKRLGHEVIGTQASSHLDSLFSFNLETDRITQKIGQEFLIEGQTSLYVIICAALSQLDKCTEVRDLSYRINVLGTKKLIDDLMPFSKQIIFISSSFVFNGKTGYYDEDSVPDPINDYGHQKLEIEKYLLAFNSNGNSNNLIVRIDKLLGDTLAEKHLFAEWMTWLNQSKPIQCIKDQIFSPTSVHDIARAIELLIENRLDGIYHVNNSEIFSRQELARQFLLLSNRPGKIICKSQKELGFLALRPAHSFLDSSKLISATGIRFTLMRDLIQSYLSKYDAAVSERANPAQKEYS